MYLQGKGNKKFQKTDFQKRWKWSCLYCKDAEVDFSILVTLTQVIDEVDGEKLNSVKLENFINKLPALDMRKIQNAIDTLNACVGLDVDLFVSCHNCGGDVHTYFRFGQEFFRPTNI